MAPKKEETENLINAKIPTKEIQEGINTVQETTEDVLTQATRAVGTMMDLSKQASRIATSLGLGTTKEATTATAGLASEMSNATGTLMNTSVDMLHAGSDAMKTTARIGVNALNTTVNLARDMAQVFTGVVLLSGEIISAAGEIFEVTGRMIKTFGNLTCNIGKMFK